MRTPVRCEANTTRIAAIDVKMESRMTTGSECHYIVTLTEAAKTGRKKEIATSKLVSTHFYCEIKLFKMFILAGRTIPPSLTH